MKRLTLFLSLVVLFIFFATAGAFMQDGSLPGGAQNPRPKPSRELPRTYLNHNRRHKLILKQTEKAVYDQFAKAGAIRAEVNYGSYKLVVVDEEAAGGRSAVEATPVSPRDDLNLIAFNGYLLDTSNSQPLSEDLPADLKRSRISAAGASSSGPGKGLYMRLQRRHRFGFRGCEWFQLRVGDRSLGEGRRDGHLRE